MAHRTSRCGSTGWFSRAGRTAARRGSTLVLVLGVLIVAAILIVAIWFFLKGEAEASSGPVTKEVLRGPFDHIVLEQGEVESSSNIEIRCEVKSRNSAGTQVLWVVPEGTHVTKGELLVKLDASALERERDTQLISLNTSEALVIQAGNTLEAAKIARIEYLEGTYRQEEQTAEGAVFVAKQNLRTAQLSFVSGERLAAKGVVSALQLEGDQFAVDKAQKELDAAVTKLTVLRKYTRDKNLKQFDSDIATSSAKFESEKSSNDLEKKKLRDIEDQMAKCEIKAPADGQIVYANVQSSRGGGSEFVLEPGANVREGQVIIRLPDPSQMQVKAKVNESRVTLLKPGMQVVVKLDAFGDAPPLHGEVTRVNQYAEPGSWFSSQVKEYATFVRIDDPPAGIRPGLSAAVSVYVEQRPDALQVPVQAIFEHGGEMFCLVKQPSKGELTSLEPRRVTIGSSNDSFVTIENEGVVAGGDGIKEGLEPKELVVMDPRKYAASVKLPEVSETPVDKDSTDVAARAKVRAAQKDAAQKAGEKTGMKGPDAPEAPGKGAGGKGGPGAAVAGPGGAGGPGAGGGPPGAGGPGAGAPGAGGPGGGGRPDPAAMFARLDANSDGKLTSDELASIPEQFRGRMMAADTNSDGTIDREEYMANAQRRQQQGGGGPGGGAPGGPGGGGPGRSAPGGNP